MIGIVVVSHSHALAQAAVGLAAEMVQGPDRPRIEVAAGLDEATFGTDAAAVAAAITAVDGPDGVLVLLDLGSAVLSAEMALEFVEPDVARRVRLSAAPLVEGLVSAVVLAASGAAIDEVVEEAGRALAPKQQQLGASGDDSRVDAVGPSNVVTPAASVDETSVDVLVSNAHGLHARPAAKLVRLVRSFDAVTRLTNLDTGRGPVNAASLSLVATLDSRAGHRLRVSATGPEAEAALSAVQALAERGFDDAPAEPVAAALGAGSGLDVAVGPALVPSAPVDVRGYDAGDPATEAGRLSRAVATVVARTTALRDNARHDAGAEAAEIFDAHLDLLEDPEIRTMIEADVAEGGTAVRAWSDRMDKLARQFADLADPYQRARAADVRSLRDQVLTELLGGRPDDRGHAGREGVLIVPELDPATAASIDPAWVTGVVTISGGSTGHGVIIARSRGLPIITDVAEAAEVVPGALVGFDARHGYFVVDPDDEERRRLLDVIDTRARERLDAVATASLPATSRDGVRFTVLANVASVAEAQEAARLGADGSGLVRTEILFADRTTAEPPDTDAQLAEFVKIASALDGRPITIRTWDVGGDKPLPFLAQPLEANPFLGVRGLRLMRLHPVALLEQLMAVCRAAQSTEVHVMFPMVSTVEEVTWTRGQLAEAARRTTGDVPPGLKVGIMIEVPAAALRVEHLAAGLDFVSVGTNDLAQYTLAAERGNAQVADLVDPLDPAVLGLVDRVCRKVPEGVEVAVCGQLASDLDGVVLLAGLGVRELSATAASVPMVKARLRDLDVLAANALAAEALTLSSAAAVRRLLSSETTRLRVGG